MKKYYDTLGISRGASPEEIKKAYRKLAHQHHPDKTGGDDTKFKEINEAYEHLTNSDKQSTQGGGPSGFGGFTHGGGFGFDINDLFRDHFSGRRNGNFPEPGQDIRIEVNVTLYDILTAAKRSIDYQLIVDCDICNGTGAEERENCGVCQGQGAVRRHVNNGGMIMQSFVPCHACSGQGFIATKTCTHCDRGKRPISRTLEFQIAAESNNGTVLRFNGHGGPGKHGGPPGDAYIRIHLDLPQGKLTEEQLAFVKDLYVRS
ncbi:J domain-containing protein [bacterium]|nr:J domain-containing protein [bacterium]